MTNDEFLQHRSAVFVRKSEKPKKMIDRASLIWNEIALQQFNFERQAVELAELDTVTLDDIRQVYNVSICNPYKKFNTGMKFPFYFVNIMSAYTGNTWTQLQPKEAFEYSRCFSG